MAQRFYWKQYVTDKQVTFYIADLVLKPGEQIEAHCHDYYEFFVVLKGTFLERCNGQELVMQPGMGQLLGPDDVHTLSNPFGEQNLLYNIAVRKDRYEQLTAPLFGSGNGSKDAPVFDLGSESLEGFREKIRLLHQLWESSGEKEFLLQSICCDVLVNILLKGRENSAPDWLSELYDRMQEPENFTQGLTRMLELAGKSQAYLNRAFYKYYGQTPTAFINSCRMTEACRLLRSTEEKILDIAYSCGYENLSYFNRQFRARYGQTPKEYRSQKRFFE